MFMSGRCLHFMGLLPNTWMSRHPLKYNHQGEPKRLICMDVLNWTCTDRLSGLPVIRWSVLFKLCLEAQAAHIFLRAPMGGAHIPTRPPFNMCTIIFSITLSIIHSCMTWSWCAKLSRVAISVAEPMIHFFKVILHV